MKNSIPLQEKFKELQLQKERELNEEFDRGADSFTSFNLH